MSRLAEHAARAAFVAAAVGWIGWSGGALNARYAASRRVLDDAQIPRPTVARIVALGHTEWVVDVLWVNATLYYGDTLVGRLPSRYVRRYAETMATLDPHFRPSYLWGALAMVYRTVNVSTEDVRVAIAMLRRGLAEHPDDPEMEGQLGIYLGTELGPRLRAGSEERRQVRAEAGEHLRRAAAVGWGPAWLGLAAATFLAETGRVDDAVGILHDVLSRASDEALRVRAESRLQALLRARGGDDPTTALLRASESARRADLPWIWPTLYVFVGGDPLDRRGEARPSPASEFDHSNARLR